MMKVNKKMLDCLLWIVRNIVMLFGNGYILTEDKQRKSPYLFKINLININSMNTGHIFSKSFKFFTEIFCIFMSYLLIIPFFWSRDS